MYISSKSSVFISAFVKYKYATSEYTWFRYDTVLHATTKKSNNKKVVRVHFWYVWKLRWLLRLQRKYNYIAGLHSKEIQRTSLIWICVHFPSEDINIRAWVIKVVTITAQVVVIIVDISRPHMLFLRTSGYRVSEIRGIFITAKYCVRMFVYQDAKCTGGIICKEKKHFPLPIELVHLLNHECKIGVADNFQPINGPDNIVLRISLKVVVIFGCSISSSLYSFSNTPVKWEKWYLMWSDVWCLFKIEIYGICSSISEVCRWTWQLT